jgi:hypothetical protein
MSSHSPPRGRHVAQVVKPEVLVLDALAAAVAVELTEPELVARLVRVAAQVTEVLHQHEGRVVLGPPDRPRLGHRHQRRRRRRCSCSLRSTK